jgi:hypothetical protein
MARLSETHVIVPLFEPKDTAGGAYVSDAIDLAKLDSFTAVLTFGAITGNSVLTVNADTTAALATSLTTPIAFKYRQGAADFKVALADQLGEPTAVALTGLTLTAATFDHTTVIIEIDPDTLVSGAHWVTFNITSTANPCLVAAIGIGRPRYAGHLNPSVI